MKTKVANLINQMEVEYVGTVNHNGWNGCKVNQYEITLNGDVYEYYRGLGLSPEVNAALKLEVLESILLEAISFMKLGEDSGAWMQEFGYTYPEAKEIVEGCRNNYNKISKLLTDEEISELHAYFIEG